eukprot:3941476-Rhodomonas_salina.4
MASIQTKNEPHEQRHNFTADRDQDITFLACPPLAVQYPVTLHDHTANPSHLNFSTPGSRPLSRTAAWKRSNPSSSLFCVSTSIFEASPCIAPTTFHELRKGMARWRVAGSKRFRLLLLVLHLVHNSTI